MKHRKENMMNDMCIATLLIRYTKHVALYEAHGKRWNLCAARGLRKLIVELALVAGDDDALNYVWGAPHWLTFTDDQVCHA